MDKILRELYHGAIHPEEAYRPMSEEHRQAQKQVEQEKSALLNRIEDSQLREEIEDLLVQITALEAMEMEDVYIQGMKMGARLALGLLDEKSPRVI